MAFVGFDLANRTVKSNESQGAHQWRLVGEARRPDGVNDGHRLAFVRAEDDILRRADQPVALQGGMLQIECSGPSLPSDCEST